MYNIECVWTVDKVETKFTLQTSERRLARAIMELAAENDGLTVTVNKTATAPVKFRGIE